MTSRLSPQLRSTLGSYLWGRSICWWDGEPSYGRGNSLHRSCALFSLAACNTWDFCILWYILRYDISRCYFGLVWLGIALVRFVLVFGSFADFREIWWVAPFGKFSEFGTRYWYDNDIYHYWIIFVQFVSTFDVFSIFRKTGRICWFRCFTSFRILFPIGVLTPDFHGFHV